MSNDRATRLPEDWQPSPDLLTWAQAARPDLIPHMTIVVEDFQDYWLSASGQAARKVDWNRTFKRWVRTTTPPKKYHRSQTNWDVVL